MLSEQEQLYFRSILAPGIQKHFKGKKKIKGKASWFNPKINAKGWLNRSFDLFVWLTFLMSRNDSMIYIFILVKELFSSLRETKKMIQL